ncbi:hypothetical protein DLM46_16625 [Paraburkholderia lacunae]|uniref:Uncharacterized protein n=2 Tax=Paraburkholderia lacunae TaxID=2211104 RepID=A0A370N768_9BURK|nr:hypothetical protein DLM46_16625 [Paraburkholderia lacunae]
MVEGADVADFTSYRNKKLATERYVPGNESAARERARLARTEAIAQFDAQSSPAIAFAAVLLSEDGTITLAASGIEPEFAPAISAGLLRLRKRINSHGDGHRPPPRRLGGFARLIPLFSLACMAATYVNTVAWVDAALSLAAQVGVSYALTRWRTPR